ncbi:MAG: co-chaperone GroES [Gammaproteobacteria bacterium]|nr:co-chaperone GroES [Gammaproteobacteria bacterium]
MVIRDPDPEKTPGGIVIPEQAKERLTRGTVLAVGPGKRAPSALAQKLAAAWGRYIKEHPEAVDTEVDDTIADVVHRLDRLAPSVEPGDKVLFGKYTGNEARVKDEHGVEHDCVLCDEEELYGVIE